LKRADVIHVDANLQIPIGLWYSAALVTFGVAWCLCCLDAIVGDGANGDSGGKDGILDVYGKVCI